MATIKNDTITSLIICYFYQRRIRIDFLRLPRPQGERRKSIYSPWGWGK